MKNKHQRLTQKQNSLISEVGSIFYMGRSQYYSFKEILEWISVRIYQSENYKKIPQYMHHYIDGYIRANWDRVEREEIEQKIFWDGELISTKDSRLSGHWAEINNLSDDKKPHMYWKGTDKIYY